MTATNDITGDKIQTKPTDSEAYAEGWERIFGEKQPEENKEVKIDGSENKTTS